jgi:hypothetical protein
MSDKAETLKEEILGLYLSKEFLSIEDLEAMLSTYKVHLSHAVEDMELEPYQRSAKSVHNLTHELKEGTDEDLEEFLDIVRQNPNVRKIEGIHTLVFCMSGFDLKFVIDIHKLPELRHILEGYEKLFRRNVQDFEDLERNISNHINLDITPNDIFDGEQVCLAQGAIIIPQKRRKYQVFSFRYSPKEAFVFKPLRKYSISSLNDAVRAIPQNMLGTIVTASNTQNYPLTETVLPIVARKYYRMIG